MSTYASGTLNPCIFEYVYLSRPDSTIDSVNVYQSRLEMVKLLAKKIQKTLTEDELKGIDFKNIEISNDNFGKPYIKLKGSTADFLKKKIKRSKYYI